MTKTEFRKHIAEALYLFEKREISLTDNRISMNEKVLVKHIINEELNLTLELEPLIYDNEDACEVSIVFNSPNYMRSLTRFNYLRDEDYEYYVNYFLRDIDPRPLAEVFLRDEKVLTIINKY